MGCGRVWLNVYFIKVPAVPWVDSALIYPPPTLDLTFIDFSYIPLPLSQKSHHIRGESHP